MVSALPVTGGLGFRLRVVEVTVVLPPDSAEAEGLWYLATARLTFLRGLAITALLQKAGTNIQL